MKRDNHNEYRVCMLSSVNSAFDVRIFNREAKTLVKSGYKVYFVVTHNKEEIIEGVHIIPISKRKSRFYRFFIKDWIILFKSIRINAILYHFNNPDLILIGLILKLIGKKVVYDVHENVCLDILSKEWIFPPIRKVISLIIKFIEWFSLHFFDKIIVAGKDIQLQSHFRKFHHKIILIRNYPTITISAIEIFPKPKDKIRFIYAGGITYGRAIMEIIKAYKYIEYSNSELIILGKFNSNDFKNKILNSINNFINIKYIPSVSYREMFNLLKKCHAGLICFEPLLNNIGALSGRNNKIYEYMMAGLAIIGSNFESWNNFILGNKIGVTVDPNNVSEISRAMNFLIENPERILSMEKNAKRLSNKYSWESERHKLINLYKELCC
jgi:glycosyltransferase involved in cell wall biosynthesis